MHHTVADIKKKKTKAEHATRIYVRLGKDVVIPCCAGSVFGP